MSDTETAERLTADAEHEAARATQAAAGAATEATAKAEREAEREAVRWAAREAERAAAWAVTHPDLPLPAAVPRPVVPVVPVLPVAPASLVVPPVVVVPWQAPIMHAVAEGTFSPGVGDALLRGLGTLDQAITAEKLAAALLVLLVEAPGMNTEQAYKRARRLRDDLDAAGILAREKQARDDTTWSLWRRADGMVTLHALMAPEQGELWMATYNALTSPRRGGVRFVDPERALWAQSVKDDPRTVAQIAADSFTQLLKLGADADPNTLFGGRRPVVQVIVTEHDRPTSIPAPSTFPAPRGRTATADAPVMTPAATTSNSPFGYIEGNPAPVSAETIERHLFNREQRRALSARDGGCRWPGCDQSPSWSESHHVENWADLGLSNIDHAILLCAHQHMLLHNQHWKILLQSGLYWLQPPVEIDPKQALIALPSKNPLMQPPLALNQPTSTTAVAGTADHGASRDGGLDRLDQRRGDDPRAGHQHDDYRH